jgi:hypothetical protein
MHDVISDLITAAIDTSTTPKYGAGASHRHKIKLKTSHFIAKTERPTFIDTI